MSDVIECPYCGKSQDVNTDDFSYEEGELHEQLCEDELHEQLCYECEKTFTFTVSVSYSFEAYKADCLNGEAHKLIMSRTIPKWLSRMQCEDCDYERKPTLEEFVAAGVDILKVCIEKGIDCNKITTPTAELPSAQS